MLKSTYPETLFHFCGFEEKGENTLKKILNCKAFIPSYAKERIISINNNEVPYFYVPMVSFCDFKVHELNMHFTKYGKFGLGISKKWAIKKGLNPVFYFNQDAELFSEMWESIFKIYSIIGLTDPAFFSKIEKIDLEVLKSNIDDLNPVTKIIASEFPRLLKLFMYSKNYEGELKRGDKIEKNFRFADDREWRYVPAIGNGFGIIHENICNRKEKLNEMIQTDHYLKFEYDEIKFIFVPDANTRLNLISFIEELKFETRININLLISKIMVINDLDL